MPENLGGRAWTPYLPQLPLKRSATDVVMVDWCLRFARICWPVLFLIWKHGTADQTCAIPSGPLQWGQDRRGTA